MGGSQSMEEERYPGAEDEDDHTDDDDDSQDNDAVGGEISPIVSDLEEEVPMSEHLFRGSSSASLLPSDHNNTNPWNLFQAYEENAAEDETTFQDIALSTFSFLSGEAPPDPCTMLENCTSLHDSSRSNGIFLPWGMMVDSRQEEATDFVPPKSQNYEWMSKSIESLLVGYLSRAPILAPPEERSHENASSSCATGTTAPHGKTGVKSARSPERNSLSNRTARRRSRTAESEIGPNIILSLLAREATGKPAGLSNSTAPATDRLREMGGKSLCDAIDKPTGGMVSDVALLKLALDNVDWTETQTIISGLSPRLIGDPSVIFDAQTSGRTGIDDPSLPATASRFHAGGGRLGFERDAFVLAGGVELLIRVFREPAFVGGAIERTNDARELSKDMIEKKLAGCWNEVLVSLRELVYAMPILVENGTVLDGGDFLPFLFTLLAHDACFDGAVTLIEEILSVMSQSLQRAQENLSRTGVYVAPVSTFFLGNVPNLYELWEGFDCRQLAHFCRLLALLVFEQEDMQALESPGSLKSMELLQLRRDRNARAGFDATVEMNQAVLLGDVDLFKKLLKLLQIINYAPPLSRTTPYHIMAHFPFMADTLFMVGLSEINDWNEIDRLDKLARMMLSGTTGHVSQLGSVADMLESLSGMLNQQSSLSNIIHVINAAQQAGVVVGAPRPTQASRREGDSSIDNLTVASARLADQFLVRPDEGQASVQVVGVGVEESLAGDPTLRPDHLGDDTPTSRITTPDDAANEMQLNALVLARYQVEVLFVICTLLGGRRKIDAQNIARDYGLIPILDEMFDRLCWGSLSSAAASITNANPGDENGASGSAQQAFGSDNGSQQQEQLHGIHGPGCECTPESALTIQYLRILHNFCDRDCENHSDRRLLLSGAEREFVFSTELVHATDVPSLNLQPGILTKVMKAFISEPDDSPYRFWLASCVESFLRGSCSQEQLFAAKSGLLNHLVEFICSDRLHCTGSLQTSFDLLGEICKGNPEILQLLMIGLDETSFQRLMTVAVSNLVDSNVFIRALILSMERISVSQPKCQNKEGAEVDARWKSKTGPSTRTYLTHSWWDTAVHSSHRPLDHSKCARSKAQVLFEEENCDDSRPSDWFPPLERSVNESLATASVMDPDVRSNVGIGHNGWIFSPDHGGACSRSHHLGSWALDNDACYSPNTIERLCWFLDANRVQLLHDLLRVVNLGNINHENICCLNTAVVLVMFAHRRNELGEMLRDFTRLDDESRLEQQRRRRLVEESADTTITDAMRSLDISGSGQSDSFAHSAIVSSRSSHESSFAGADKEAALNFRELMWFWQKYYNRGRDRLSIEFSSRMRFEEWKTVVSLLSADDGSCTSLLSRRPRLPRSPYQRAPRVVENHFRGA